MPTRSQILLILALVFGIPALCWIIVWRLYRARWRCPACAVRTLRFVIGYRPARTAYLQCSSCSSRARLNVSFLQLTLRSCGVRFGKEDYVFASVSEQEWKKFLDHR
jgi:hypothetical protein